MNLNDIISTLQENYNILVVFHPSCQEEKRIFVVNSFTPPQGLTHLLDLKGKEITNLISDNSFYTQFSMNRQTGVSRTEFKTGQFDTKLDEIPMRHYQFAPDFTWEWYLSS